MMMEGRIGDNWFKQFPTNQVSGTEQEVCTVSLEFDVLPEYAWPVLQRLMQVAHEELTQSAPRQAAQDVLAKFTVQEARP